MTDIDKVRELANNASGFIDNFSSEDSEYIQVHYADDENGCFYGCGEWSGEEYRIEYADVDLEQAKFFKLIPLN